MTRRIGFVGLNLLAIGVVGLVFGITAREDFPSPGAQAAEPRGGIEISPATAPSVGVTLPIGYVQVGARVLAEPSSHLILPGDIVDLAEEAGGSPVISGARVMSIDPPLNRSDKRMYVTFGLEENQGTQLKSLRRQTLLHIRLVSPGPAHHAADFGDLRPAELITRRYAGEGWRQRLNRQ